MIQRPGRLQRAEADPGVERLVGGQRRYRHTADFSLAQKNRSGALTSSTSPRCRVFAPGLRSSGVTQPQQPDQVILENLMVRRTEQHPVVDQRRSFGQNRLGGRQVVDVSGTRPHHDQALTGAPHGGRQRPPQRRRPVIRPGRTTRHGTSETPDGDPLFRSASRYPPADNARHGRHANRLGRASASTGGTRSTLRRVRYIYLPMKTWRPHRIAIIGMSWAVRPARRRGTLLIGHKAVAGAAD